MLLLNSIPSGRNRVGAPTRIVTRAPEHIDWMEQSMYKKWLCQFMVDEHKALRLSIAVEIFWA